MEKMLDAKGLTCPKPVILTKKEMDQSSFGHDLCISCIQYFDRIFVSTRNDTASYETDQ